jgi:imidazole glycerol-phosphate synthase subunit HisH
MKIGIIDYNAGNLGSVTSAIKALGHEVSVLKSFEDFGKIDSLVIPGVGSFGHGMEHLEKARLVEPLKLYFESGKNLIGICLGMHLLASSGLEGKECSGLGIVPGVVRKLHSVVGEKVPHLGWDSIEERNSITLTTQQFYFAHSYYFDIEKNYESSISATFSWGNQDLPAIIRYKNCTAFQFHPEKSSHSGMKLLADVFKSRD